MTWSPVVSFQPLRKELISLGICKSLCLSKSCKRQILHWQGQVSLTERTDSSEEKRVILKKCIELWLSILCCGLTNLLWFILQQYNPVYSHTDWSYTCWNAAWIDNGKNAHHAFYTFIFSSLPPKYIHITSSCSPSCGSKNSVGEGQP